MRAAIHVGFYGLGLSLLLACSASGPGSELDGTGDDGAGAGEVGFTGSDGSGALDPGTGTGSGSGEQEDCAATSSEAQNVPAPADVIIAVDTSGSMGAEAGWTQDNLPGLVATVTGSGVDTHVVLIANNEMCVPAPLGSGNCGCPNGDEALPSYRHVCNGVGSHNALQLILQTYPQWKDSLRPNATKTFVVVSDDDSDLGSAAFTQQLVALDPSLAGFKLDAIVSSASPFVPGKCWLLSAAEGKVYHQLVSQTGGVVGDLCEQNFAPVFQDMATQVIENAGISCDYDIPDPPEGETINPNKVNVEYRSSINAAAQVLYNVPAGAPDCGPGGGWYFDNPASPSKILLCKTTCDMVQQSVDGRVDVLFGCDTAVGPPN